MDVRLIGPVRAFENGTAIPFPGMVHRLALAILASNPGRPVTAEQLIDWLWPDDEYSREPRKDPRAGLHEILSKMRGAVKLAGGDGRAYLPEHNGGYHLVIDRGRVDLLRYLDRIAEARKELNSGGPEQAIVRFREAFREWGDERTGRPAEALAGLPGDWAQLERHRLDTGYLRDRTDCVGLELKLGRQQQVVPELVGLVALAPGDERIAGLLMLAHYRSGQPDLAHRAFAEISARLKTEYDTEPCNDLKDLYRRIQQQDGDLRPASAGLIDLTTCAPNPPAPQGEPMTVNHYTNNANGGSIVGSMASTVEKVVVNGMPTAVSPVVAGLEKLRTSLKASVNHRGISADMVAAAEALLDAALLAVTRASVPDRRQFVSALEQVKLLFDGADSIISQVDELLTVAGGER